MEPKFHHLLLCNQPARALEGNTLLLVMPGLRGRAKCSDTTWGGGREKARDFLFFYYIVSLSVQGSFLYLFQPNE